MVFSSAVFDSFLKLDYNQVMISPLEIALRLALGAVIGGIIGFEREIHGRAAGFRTQLIVCVASVLIMIVSENYYFYIHNVDDTLRIDPARISAGALIGIGFLGSGVIIKSGYVVRGLTTAASIWIVSAIGLAIGGGLYFEGLVTAAITVIALIVLRLVERKIRTMRFKNITITTAMDADAEENIRSAMSALDVHIHSSNYEYNRPGNEITYNFSVAIKDRKTVAEIFTELRKLDFLQSVKITG